MNKLYPDCDYFNDERDSEFAPKDGECESCYRYEICSEIKKSTETHVKVYTPRKDSILVIETYSDNISRALVNELNEIRNSIKSKFPEIRMMIIPNVKEWNFKTYEDKQYLIYKLKGMIKELEESEE